MLPNLLFLENHSDPTTAKFFIRNFNKFKELGYIIALEAPDIEFEGLKWMSEDLLKKYKVQFNSTPEFPIFLRKRIIFDKIDPVELQIRFFNAMKDSGIPFQPVESVELHKLSHDAASNGHLNQFVVKRDKHIAKQIIKLNASRQNGVIYYGGLAHNHLAKILAKNSTIPTIVILMKNLAMERKAKDLQEEIIKAYRISCLEIPDDIKENVRILKILTNSAETEKFYEQKVYSFIESDKDPITFDDIEHQFLLTSLNKELTELEMLEETPAIGRDFNKATGFNFQYARDKYNVLYAEFRSEDIEKLNLAKKSFGTSFPNLTTFFSKKDPNRLLIRGVNLPENEDALLKLVKK
jgi:predicted protein tyrosine phosphatase